MNDLLLLQNALRDALRPRRLGPALLLMVLPGAIALLQRVFTPGEAFAPGAVYDTLVVALVFSFTLAILSVIYGTGIVSQELEQRTIVYLLTRPYPRWRILLTKFIVAVAVIAAISVVSAFLLALAVYGPTKIGSAGLGADAGALAMGAVAYGAVFLFLGAVLPRPLTWGLLFVFGWESWVPTLPGQFARISIMTYLRTLASRDLSPASGGSGGNFLANLAPPPKIDISSAQAWTILALVALVFALAAHIVFSVKEYVPRENAD